VCVCVCVYDEIEVSGRNKISN